MKENKTYIVADFERYHSGTMPAGEMHALEKAALEDPFLADALEGFAYSSSAEKDIEELGARLNKKRERNVFSLYSISQSGWWRIAALFIIVAGAGYFLYNINYTAKENPPTKNDLATTENETSTAGKKDSNIAMINTDSATANSDIAFENHQVRKFEETKKTSLPRPESQVDKKVMAYDDAREPAPSALAMKSKDISEKQIEENSKNENDKAIPSQFFLKGKVTDDVGNPVAFATIRDAMRNKVTMADSAGQFSLKSPDSNTIAIVSAVGYANKKVTLQKDEQPTITISRSEGDLNDVTVVTAMGKKKNNKRVLSRSDAFNGKAAGTEINQSLANTDKFDQYLKENIKPIYDDENNVQTGEVFLSFTTDKNGTPDKIKIVKSSSCKECEKEAIRLLKNGPDWMIINEKWRTVQIKF